MAKKEPAVFATALATLVSTILYVAPGLGIAIPDTIAKVIATVLTLAAGVGIRSVVTPVTK